VHDWVEPEPLRGAEHDVDALPTARISSAMRASMEKTEAAWSTASQPSRARSTAAGSVTSPIAVSTPSTPSGSSAAGTRSGDRASTRTRCPALANAATECDPT